MISCDAADPASGRRGFGRSGFGREFRLLDAKEFSEVFSARRVCRGGNLFLLHFRENGLGRPRLGLVIPKKQARNAVLRNAIKRQAREAFRLKRADLPALDLVLRLTRPVSAMEKKRWRAEIEALFGQLGGKEKNLPQCDFEA